MTEDKKFLLLRNNNLWCHLSDEEYEELHVAHHFIEEKKESIFILTPTILTSSIF